MGKQDRSHARAPGMRQTSIALPEELMTKLTEIANREYRSRNKLIEMYLQAMVDEEARKGENITGRK